MDIKFELMRVILFAFLISNKEKWISKHLFCWHNRVNDKEFGSVCLTKDMWGIYLDYINAAYVQFSLLLSMNQNDYKCLSAVPCCYFTRGLPHHDFTCLHMICLHLPCWPTFFPPFPEGLNQALTLAYSYSVVVSRSSFLEYFIALVFSSMKVKVLPLFGHDQVV